MATSDVAMPKDEPVSVRTFLAFLIGSRDAILRVASSPSALWVGLLFVLSAGFAREYDGADLLHQPWHLLLPLAASLGTSFLLYCLIHLAIAIRGVDGLRFWPGYRTFLTFYWFTAPLAWLYAVPVERFLSAGDATATNLWFLFVVSLWRVLLITRALSVWLNANFAATLSLFFVVMLFADSVAIALTFIMPVPIFNIMGGVRLSEPDSVVVDAVLIVQVFGILSWLVWLVGVLVALSIARQPWSVAAATTSRRIGLPLWALAASLILIGLAILPFGQPQQRHAFAVERLLKSNNLAAAVDYMAQLPRDAFPPIWDPSPRVGYGQEKPDVVEVLSTMIERDAPQWAGQLYVEKLPRDPLRAFQDALPDAQNPDASRFEAVLAAYEKFAPIDTIDPDRRRGLREMADSPELDPALRERLKQYLGASDDH